MSIESLRVVPSRPSRAGTKQHETAGEAGAPPERRLASAHQVLFCGQSPIDAPSLVDTLASHGYRVVRRPSLREATSLLERDPGVIAIVAASAAGQAEALDTICRLDPRCRRRVLAVVWRPARRAVRQLIEAGVGDFLMLPALTSELLLRVELRVREARSSIFAERSAVRNSLPEVNHLNGAFGGESDNVRLSDREFLLYDILSQRFETVVSRAEILARIWGRTGQEPASNIVDVYVRYLRVKLAKVAPRLVITTVRHVGYVLERREISEVPRRVPGTR